MKNKSSHLPLSGQILYSIGQCGWAILINIMNLQLVYFYLPPDGSDLKIFISQAVFLLILNAITILAAAGRLWDAITDPLIASLSDNWKGKKGRRMPFMKAGAIPAALFCLLMFIPIVNKNSSWNIAWLFIMQTMFYLFITIYVTPYIAMMPELGQTPEEKLNLSTWISITYAIGIMIASQIPKLGELLISIFNITSKVLAIQLSIGIISFISIIFMYIPVIFIDEKKYCKTVPANMPIFQAMKKAFGNKFFIFYLIADASYFIGLTIILTGLLYYITVLLGLAESLMGIFLPIMIIVSFVFYPVVNLTAKKIGKKILIVLSFFLMSFIYSFVYFLGKMPILNLLQAYLFIVLYSIPLSFLSILPNAVLADIAEHNALKTGIRQEGIFLHPGLL